MRESPGCPVDYELMRQLWRQNGPIINELHEVVSPLAAVASEAIKASLASGEDVISSWPGQAAEPVTDDLPYSGDLRADPYRSLPPTFFGEDEHKLRELKVPDSKALRDVLVTEFLAEHQEKLDRAVFGKLITRSVASFAQSLPETLDQLAQQGTAVDPDRWADYLAGAKGQQRGQYHLEHLSGHREENVQPFVHDYVRTGLLDRVATGRFDRYMYRATSLLIRPGMTLAPLPAGYIVVPVGAYGSAFAEQLLRTTLYCVELSNVVLAEHAREVVAGHEGIIRRHTARGHAAEGRLADDAAVASVEEGIISIMQAVALLTAERVEGYDDPVQLVRALADNELIPQLARTVPMGVVAPLALGGAYIPGMVQHLDGRLQLNPDVMAELRQAKRAQISAAAGLWTMHRAVVRAGAKDAPAPSTTGLVCPAAMPHGGIDRLSDAMARGLAAMRMR